MALPASDTPSPDEIDIPALREKYRQERHKRLRKEGQGQYLEPVGEFANAYESDPHMRVEPRAPIVTEIDVAILGAGFCGMLTAIELKKAGIANFRNIVARNSRSEPGAQSFAANRQPTTVNQVGTVRDSLHLTSGDLFLTRNLRPVHHAPAR